MEAQPIENHEPMNRWWNKFTNTCVYNWLKYFSKVGSVEIRSVENGVVIT